MRLKLYKPNWAIHRDWQACYPFIKAEAGDKRHGIWQPADCALPLHPHLGKESCQDWSLTLWTVHLCFPIIWLICWLVLEHFIKNTQLTVRAHAVPLLSNIALIQDSLGAIHKNWYQQGQMLYFTFQCSHFSWLLLTNLFKYKTFFYHYCPCITNMAISDSRH